MGDSEAIEEESSQHMREIVQLYQQEMRKTAQALDLPRDSSKRDSSRTDMTRQPSVAASHSASESLSLHSEEASADSAEDAAHESESEEQEGGRSQEGLDLAEGTQSNAPSEDKEAVVAGAGQEHASDAKEKASGSQGAADEAKEEAEAEEEDEDEGQSEADGEAEAQPESDSDSEPEDELEAEEELEDDVLSQGEQASGPARDLLAELDQVADGQPRVQKPDTQPQQLEEALREASASLHEEEVVEDDVVILGDTPPEKPKCR